MMLQLPAISLVLLIKLFPTVCPYTPLSNEYKLEYVSAIFRHGDRTPTLVYPNSPYQESFWPQGFGQLTRTGMREEYHLGEIYNNIFVDAGLLSKKYTRSEVYIISTDVDRTLMSAESMLSALYPPDNSQQFKTDLLWQPIPVHTIPVLSDKSLRARSAPCPKYKSLLELDKTTEEYMKLQNDNKDLFEMLSRETGIDYDLSNIWTLYDELFIEYTHNLTMPSWYSDDLLFNQLTPLQSYTLNLFSDTDIKKKITGGVWANQVITNMQNKVNGDNDLKATFYSAHDTTVLGMLSVFNMYNGIQPPYSSTFVIELYSRENKYFVVFRYRNDTFSDDFVTLTHPDCSHDPCPLDELSNIMEEYMLTEDEWDMICEDDTANNTNNMLIGLSISFGICGLILIVTVVAMAIVLFAALRQRNKIRKYKELTTTEDT